VDIQRTVKEPGEIALVKKSMQVVGKVFEQVKKELKRKKWTERKLAQFIQETGFKLGAEDISFPAIVASGANATIPHHAPSSKPLRPGETIILDFGFKYKNYCSDFTRTVFLKSAPRRLANIYNQVEKAHTESIQLISYSSHVIPEATSAKREGYPESRRIDSRSPITVEDEFRGNDKRESGNDKKITGSDVYQKAVSVLAEEDLDKYFIHNLGHGTGLEIHELPNLSPGSKDILANGMVFSIEPGVYLPNVGGVRIEDLVYLEDGKANKFINVSTSLEANLIK